MKKLIILSIFIIFISACGKPYKKEDSVKKASDAKIKEWEKTGIISIRSEEHTSELQSHSFISYAVFCLKKKKK